MAKKILILSEPFAPPSFLPRITNLCKNLGRNKWTPEIFTEKIKDVNYTTDLCPVFQMPYYNSNNKIYWAIKWVLHFLFQYKDFKLQKFIEIKCNNYDIYKENLKYLSNIETVDSTTVKFTLSQPVPFFEYNLNSNINKLYTVNYYDKKGKDYNIKNQKVLSDLILTQIWER